jgi:hypothetical protein
VQIPEFALPLGEAMWVVYFLGKMQQTDRQTEMDGPHTAFFTHATVQRIPKNSVSEVQ